MTWHLIWAAIGLGVYVTARIYALKYILDKNENNTIGKISLNYFIFFLSNFLVISILTEYTNFSNIEIIATSIILLNLIFLDFELKVLPDIFTIGFLWFGLLHKSIFLSSDFSLSTAVLNIVSIYIILRIFNCLYFFTRKKEGMGMGDVKLISSFASWVSLTEILSLLLIAIFSVIVFQILIFLFYKNNKNSYFSFGPWLCISFLLVVIIK